MKTNKENSLEFIDIYNLEDNINDDSDYDNEINKTTLVFSDINISDDIKKQFSNISIQNSPIRIALGGEINMVLTRIMDRMPSREVECIIKMFYDSYNLTEVANYFKISVPRAHQLRSQAIKKLKKSIGLKKYLEM